MNLNKRVKLLSLSVSTVALLFSTAIYAQSDRLKVHKKVLYNMTFQMDSLNTASKTTELTELLLSDTVSLFRTLHKAEQDATYAAYINNKVIQLSAPVVMTIGKINNLNYQILKSNTGQIKVYDEYSGSNLNHVKEINYYTEPATAMDSWKLSSDTITIDQFLCQKAEIDFGGRHWTAWFSTEIPISDGPYKFGKLPGLILRLEDSSKTWKFEFQSIQNVDEDIELNKKENVEIKKINKDKLFKDRRYYQKNMLSIMESNGGSIAEDRKAAQERLNEVIRKDNNWIEL
ncbi:MULTISPECIES: GLPGLI family protein [Sphingobacterium]|uniref:GLPGLI family protein n=1 Tax=Sphingobacterium kitahiroshimense TaxID=470446 RepID=A0ABV0BXA1_9SPHI|nr:MULTISPECIES: GLPGLI family protein [Sphingobacterium]MCW2259355.1 GLPGLI family protein [Sphingobacterium kitahiroshimense]TCR14197.1 GLPGLI family protein [Sphingobacterium sp. JUb78]